MQRSHYIPQALFEKVNRACRERVAAPVVVKRKEAISIYSNQQPVAPLLCSDCEQRFSKHGENVVMGYCYQGNGRFPLRETLSQCLPDERMDSMDVYLRSGVENVVDVDAILYFAVSIFWRGAVGHWPSPFDNYHGALGSDYLEHFRLYLLGITALGDRVMLQVLVDVEEHCCALILTPEVDRYKDGQYYSKVHTFIMPGICFRLFVGGTLLDGGHAAVIDRLPSFATWRFKDAKMWRNIVQLVKQARPAGKLAKEVNARKEGTADELAGT